MSFIDLIKTKTIEVDASCIPDIVDWVRRNFNPDDVFSTTELDKWAESEGYIKTETQND